MIIIRKELVIIMELIDIILQFVFPLIGAIITYVLVPYLKEKRIYNYVKIAVDAAEQLAKTEVIQDKLSYVTERVKKKFKLSDEETRTLIEAAVAELNKM